ncbi:MAG: hypothetical protein QMB65_10745 [Vicingaceae bacterium]
MRNIFFLFSLALIASCSPQKNISSEGTSTGTSIKKEGSRMYGKVIVKSKPSLDGKSEIPELFFDRDGVEFFINIPLGKVSKADIRKHVYKNIDILGEIKTGAFSTTVSKSRSGEENKPTQEGAYLVIYKILE